MLDVVLPHKIYLRKLPHHSQAVALGRAVVHHYNATHEGMVHKITFKYPD